MRARELRLGRSFRCIITMLAGPVAGIAACHAAADPGADAVDGSQPASSDGGRVDASIARDATLGDSGAGHTIEADIWDPEACAAITIDGAYIDNNPDGCSTFRRLPCGLPPDTPSVPSQLEGCDVYLGSCAELCGTTSLFCLLAPPSCDDAGVRPDATLILDCVGSCGIAGRPPRGLLASRTKSTPSVGDYFAAMAHLESASVRAFRELERSLVALDAPVRLARAARRAAAEERRHARATARLAHRFGGTPQRPRVGRVPAPSLVELLEDNAVAGCVGETFAALLATWQATHSVDPRVRRTMQRIAADETRHAALAWEILHWGAPRLASRERARVRRALDTAVAQLARSGPSVGEDARTIAGHPARADERRLAGELAKVVRREWTSA
jgi:rubrerythrin